MLVLSSEVISGFLMVYRLQCGSCWISEGEGAGLSLAVVRDLRDARAVAGPGDLAALETDVLAADRPPGGIAASSGAAACAIGPLTELLIAPQALRPTSPRP